MSFARGSVIKKLPGRDARQQIEEAAEMINMGVADYHHVERFQPQFRHFFGNPVAVDKRSGIDQNCAAAGLMQNHRVSLADIENMDDQV